MSIKKITLAGLLIALEVVLQLIGNNVAAGGVSINLSLIPIILGGLFGGPFLGGLIGLINGILVLFSPSTIAIFMPLTLGGTIFVCLFKSTIAGIVCGFVFKAFKYNKNLGTIMCSIITPVTNSLLFIILSFVFFQDWLNNGATQSSLSKPGFVLLIAIGWNFVFELLTALILTAPIYKTLSKTFKEKEL